QKSHARENRMAEIASPASDPRSLRRHYPHQVQRVRLNDVSAKRLPRSLYLVQNKTRLCEVNDEQNRRPSVMVGLQALNVIVTRRLKLQKRRKRSGCYWPAAGFTLVWKIANHFPFSCFHTVPAL